MQGSSKQRTSLRSLWCGTRTFCIANAIATHSNFGTRTQPEPIQRAIRPFFSAKHHVSNFTSLQHQTQSNRLTEKPEGPRRGPEDLSLRIQRILVSSDRENVGIFNFARKKSTGVHLAALSSFPPFFAQFFLRSCSEMVWGGRETGADRRSSRLRRLHSPAWFSLTRWTRSSLSRTAKVRSPSARSTTFFRRTGTNFFTFLKAI